MVFICLFINLSTDTLLITETFHCKFWFSFYVISAIFFTSILKFLLADSVYDYLGYVSMELLGRKYKITFLLWWRFYSILPGKWINVVHFLFIETFYGIDELTSLSSDKFKYWTNSYNVIIWSVNIFLHYYAQLQHRIHELIP